MIKTLPSFLLALCVVASATGMLAARAAAETSMVTVGTVDNGGGTNRNSYACGSLQCNNDNGCSNISNRYTEWWPSGKCEYQPQGSGIEHCMEYTMKCRHDIHYSGWFGGCSGSVTDETWHNEPGCYATVDSGLIGDNNGSTTVTAQ